MNFDNAEYKTAGAYFDSTLTNLKLNSRPYRAIKKKRDNLEDVIYYEDIAQQNDSILSLVAMSDAERLKVFQEFTDKLKKEAEEAKEKEEAEKRKNTGLAVAKNTDIENTIDSEVRNRLR